MAGFVFTLSILSILTTVGFLFAWMVRLASVPKRPLSPAKTFSPDNVDNTNS